MSSLSSIAVSLRNKALITPRVLSSVPKRLIHGSTMKEASVCDKATEAQQKVSYFPKNFT
ncbi:hypothetical protein F2Q70_00039139 [Brassica cretica]|uniref:Uncharacterized protein n=1 Tax=Brassica cretica TaxID=69181 RepID=A0A8S9KAD1_BRACR|nr:hypothetical protein F2Q70_00039139 [Brassica cretica]